MTTNVDDAFLVAMARRRMLAHAGGSAMRSGHRVAQDDRAGETTAARAENASRARAVAKAAREVEDGGRPARLDVPQRPTGADRVESEGSGALMRRLHERQSVRGVTELRQDQARDRMDEAADDSARRSVRDSTAELRRVASRGILDAMAR